MYPLLKSIDFIDFGFYNAKESEKLENPFFMQQVHGAKVNLITPTSQPWQESDAMITQDKNIKLTVRTADCVPLLLADSKHKIIAAIHAGWKGAFQGIIEATLLDMLKLGGNITSIIAAIGPHIQQKSFQADDKMKNLFPPNEHFLFTPHKNGKYLFDFNAYIILRLQRAGVQKIDNCLIDTYPDLNYYSYRRDNTELARQYSSIWLKS